MGTQLVCLPDLCWIHPPQKPVTRSDFCFGWMHWNLLILWGIFRYICSILIATEPHVYLRTTAYCQTFEPIRWCLMRFVCSFSLNYTLEIFCWWKLKLNSQILLFYGIYDMEWKWLGVTDFHIALMDLINNNGDTSNMHMRKTTWMCTRYFEHFLHLNPIWVPVFRTIVPIPL